MLNHDTKAYAADNGRCMTPDFGDQSGADDGAGIGIASAIGAGAVLGAEVTGHAAHHLKKDSTCPGAASVGAGLGAGVRSKAQKEVSYKYIQQIPQLAVDVGV